MNDNDGKHVSMKYNQKISLEKNSLKLLLKYLHQFEEKLISIETIHQNLLDLLTMISQTHKTIFDQFQIVRNILNQNSIDLFADDDEIIPIDSTKSEWDDDDDDDDENANGHTEGDKISNSKSEIQQENSTKEIKMNQENERKISPLTNRTDNSSLNSVLSCESSSTMSSLGDKASNNYRLINNRSSNLRKTDQHSSTMKSSKSVTFTFETLDDPLNSTQNENDDNETNHSTLVDSINGNSVAYQNHLTLSNISSRNIRIHEIEEKFGLYLRLINLSNSDDYDLSDHILQQILSSRVICQFHFPPNTFIRSGQTTTIWCGNTIKIDPQPPYIFHWKEQRKWNIGPEYLTVLIQPNGEIITSARFSHQFPTDSSSSDILFVHSKSNLTVHSNQMVPFMPMKKSTRLSPWNFQETNKGVFTNSPNNPIHPDHHRTITNLPNNFRSQMHSNNSHRSHLLKRPKSSPYTNYSGSTHDQLVRNFFCSISNQNHQNQTLKT